MIEYVDDWVNVRRVFLVRMVAGARVVVVTAPADNRLPVRDPAQAERRLAARGDAVGARDARPLEHRLCCHTREASATSEKQASYIKKVKAGGGRRAAHMCGAFYRPQGWAGRMYRV